MTGTLPDPDADPDAGADPDAIRKSVTVPLPPARAFDLFTRRMGAWWPTDRFSVAMFTGGTVARVVVEPRVGGTVHEIAADGTRADWGRVTRWEPPDTFAMDWWPGAGPGEATRLLVRFIGVEAGTRVELTHSGLRERPDGGALVDRYTSGWDLVLDGLVRAA